MSDFEWLDPSTWSWDGFNTEVSDFANSAFDTFVWDNPGNSTSSWLGDGSGSIWQDGWDIVNNIWGAPAKSDIYGDYEGYLESNMLSDTPSSKMAYSKLYGGGGASGNGLLQNAIQGGKKSLNTYAKSGDLARDALKYGLAGVSGYYKNKQAQERFDAEIKQREKESRRRYPVRKGFLLPTTGGK